MALAGLLSAGTGFARAAADGVIRVPCSVPALYNAVADHEPGDTLILASSCNYDLTSKPLVLTGEIDLRGGPSTRLIRATSADRFAVVEVAQGASVGITGLFIQGGRAPDDSHGGGIDNSGDLSLSHDTISGNSAPLGGGIFNRGKLVLSYTLVSGNDTGPLAGRGERNTTTGPQFAGAGLYNTGNTTMDMSIVRSNRAGGSGGEAAGGGVYNAGALRLVQTTIATNDARGDAGQAAGGGIYVAAGATATVLSRTLVNRNTAGNGGGIFSAGRNVVLQTSVIQANSPNNCAPAGTVSGCAGVRFRPGAPRAGALRSRIGAPRGGRRAPSAGRGAVEAG